MKTLTSLILTMAFVLSLTHPSTASAAQPRTGITGRAFLYISYGQPYFVEEEPGVWIGIGIPGVQLPVQTSCMILSAKNNRFVARFETDPSGEFTIKLPPGKYWLVPEPIRPNGPLGQVVTTSPIMVHVKANLLTPVNVFYSSEPWSIPFRSDVDSNHDSSDPDSPKQGKGAKARPNER